MKIQLNETTDFLAFMDELSRDETVQAAVQAGVEEAVRAAALIARARGPGQILGHRCLRVRQPSDISLYHGPSLYSHPGPYQRAPRRRAAIGA